MERQTGTTTEPAPVNAASGTAARRRRPRPLGVLVGLLVLAFAGFVLVRMISGIGWGELLRRLRTADPGWLALCAVGVGAHFAAWAGRWRIAVLAARSRVGFGYLYAAILAAAAVNLATPFARVFGGLLRARYLARRDAERRSGAALYGVVLFDQLVHLAVMSCGTTAMLLAGAVSAGRLGGRRLPLAVAGLAVVAVVALLAARRTGVRGRLSRRYAVRLGQESWRMLAELLAQPRVVATALVAGVGVVLLQSAAQAAAFYSIGVTPRPWVVIASILLGAAAGSLSGSPGGVGATEAAMIAIYVSQGVPAGDAAAAALLYRGTQYVVVLLIGLPAASGLEVMLAREARRESP